MKKIAGLGAIHHFDCAMLPIDLRVVLLQPCESQNHLILAKVHYFSYHLLLVTLIGDSDICAVGDVINQYIYIIICFLFNLLL